MDFAQHWRRAHAVRSAVLMADVFVRFSEPVVDGLVAFRAQASGAPLSDGRWMVWIEFVSSDRGEPLRSPRETIQPNRASAAYWSAGLTPVYLEGALNRAKTAGARRRMRSANAMCNQPAAVTTDGPGAPTWRPKAVLNPFSVYQKSEGRLRRQLSAVSPWQLVRIIRAYGLSHEPIEHLNSLPTSSLIARIVRGCRQMAGRG
jgi:hypothetical protein